MKRRKAREWWLLDCPRKEKCVYDTEELAHRDTCNICVIIKVREVLPRRKRKGKVKR